MSVICPGNVNKPLNKRWMRKPALIHIPTWIVAATSLLNMMLCIQGCSGWQVARVTEASFLSLLLQSLRASFMPPSKALEGLFLVKDIGQLWHKDISHRLF